MQRLVRLGVLTAVLGGVVAASLALTAGPATARRSDSSVPAGFRDTVVRGGLDFPIATAFAPDGRIFVGLKTGKIVEYDSFDDPTATTVIDLSTAVYNNTDRGLEDIALDPTFPARPYLYVTYALNATIGGSPPLYAGGEWDDCPHAANLGCVGSARVSRLTIAANSTATAETVLVNDWCQQYPSHSIGGLAFDPDGMLYVSGGDGASYDFADTGAAPSDNPCNDPLNEGGAFRAQDVRTTGDPTSLSGSVVRINPDTGAALSDNPLFDSGSDTNAKRMVAYGLRNPFRIAVRPNTHDLYVANVGWYDWEELNLAADVLDAPVKNFGWPCYEGTEKQWQYKDLLHPLCKSLDPSDPTYAGTPQEAPIFKYKHGDPVVAGEPATCHAGYSSSISALGFYTGTAFPAAYQGALFFGDYARDCIYVLGKDGSGRPDPGAVSVFAAPAPEPVDLLSGPHDNLYYVAIGDSFGSGAIHCITYDGSNTPPVAAATATPTAGNVPLHVQFDASASTDANGDSLTYAWDLDGDGQFDDSTSANPTADYSNAGEYAVRVRVDDTADPCRGVVSAPITIKAGTTHPPVPVIDTPTGATHWETGEQVSFTGHADDQDEGPLPAADLTWTLKLQHCPSIGDCHVHVISSWDGVAGGSFTAPDHEYPSYLELELTATDSDGRTASTTLDLDPKTVDTTFESEPTGLDLSVGSTGDTAPFTRTLIVGSSVNIAAPQPQSLSAKQWLFGTWSDGGARSHVFVPGSTPATVTATFGHGVGKTAPATSWLKLAKGRTVLVAATTTEDGTFERIQPTIQVTGKKGDATFRGVIYADVGGRPVTLVGQTDPITLPHGTLPGAVDITLPTPAAVAAGTYWIGLQSGPATSGAKLQLGGVSLKGGSVFVSDTWDDGPQSTLATKGKPRTRNLEPTVEAVYVPAP